MSDSPSPLPAPLPPGQLPSMVEGPSVLVRVEQPRRPRRWPWVVGGIAVVALVAAGAAVLAADDGGGGYSLDAAVNDLDDRTSVESEMELDMAMIEMTALGQTDFEEGLAAVDLDLGFGEMSILADTNDQVVYLRGDVLVDLGGLPGEAEWIRLEASDFEDLGMTPSDLTGGVGSASGNLGPLFDAVDESDDVEVLGIEELDVVGGIRAQHYVVTIDTERLAEALALSLDQMGGVGPAALADTVPVDVWVDGDDLVRQLAVDLDLGMRGMEMGLVMRFTSWDEDLGLELPDPDTVVDASELPGLFG